MRIAWTPPAIVVALLIVLGGAPAPVRAQTRSVAGFEVHVHLARQSGYDFLWDLVPERIGRIRQQLGSDVLTGGQIHVVRDINELLSQLAPGARAPRWAQAVALPSQRLIVLRVPDPGIVATLTHELSHLAVHEAAGGRHVPRWFLEGFAMLQAEEWGIERSVTIGQAALFDNTVAFDTLDREFPPHWLSAGLAYAQSFHFVRRLVDQYGVQPIHRWLALVAAGQEWHGAFREAFGTDPATEFRAWRDSVRVWYAWIPAVVSVTTFWGGLSILVIWAYRRVRRRSRRRLAAMAARERELYPPDPDDELFV